MGWGRSPGQILGKHALEATFSVTHQDVCLDDISTSSKMGTWGQKLGHQVKS